MVYTYSQKSFRRILKSACMAFWTLTLLILISLASWNSDPTSSSKPTRSCQAEGIISPGGTLQCCLAAQLHRQQQNICSPDNILTHSSLQTLGPVCVLSQKSSAQLSLSLPPSSPPPLSLSLSLTLHPERRQQRLDLQRRERQSPGVRSLCTHTQTGEWGPACSSLPPSLPRMVCLALGYMLYVPLTWADTCEFFLGGVFVQLIERYVSSFFYPLIDLDRFWWLAAVLQWHFAQAFPPKNQRTVMHLRRSRSNPQGKETMHWLKRNLKNYVNLTSWPIQW